MSRESNFFADCMPTHFEGAMCKDSGVNFFPIYPETEDAPRALCRQCPHKFACLKEALSFESWGIWGDTNQAERLELIQAATTRNGDGK